MLSASMRCCRVKRSQIWLAAQKFTNQQDPITAALFKSKRGSTASRSLVSLSSPQKPDAPVRSSISCCGGFVSESARNRKQLRGLASTTTTTHHNQHESSAGKSPNTQQQMHPGASSLSDEKQEDGGEDARSSWRRRVVAGREHITARATHLRDNARESLAEFREHPGKSMSSGAKSFSGMMQTYGPVFLGVHISVYFATLAALFAGVDSGLMDPAHLMSFITDSATADHAAVETKDTVDYVVEWMKNHAWTKDLAPFVDNNPQFASLAVAWIVVKFTEPVRLPISLFLTPRVARYLGRGPTTPGVADSNVPPAAAGGAGAAKDGGGGDNATTANSAK